jgi:hypothetical protein
MTVTVAVAVRVERAVVVMVVQAAETPRRQQLEPYR